MHSNERRKNGRNLRYLCSIVAACKCSDHFCCNLTSSAWHAAKHVGSGSILVHCCLDEQRERDMFEILCSDCDGIEIQGYENIPNYVKFKIAVVGWAVCGGGESEAGAGRRESGGSRERGFGTWEKPDDAVVSLIVHVNETVPLKCIRGKGFASTNLGAWYL